jgi:hypothetical protein
VVFGHPTPLALYGDRVPKGVKRSSPLLALPGMLLDAGFGLIPHAPVFLLALAGLPSLLRRGAREWLPHILVGLAVLGPLATWRTWWGGFCPPARFLVPLVPLLAIAIASRLAASPLGLARWRWGLLLCGLGLAVFMIARPEDTLLLNGRDDPPHVWEALRGATSPTRYLPHLTARTLEEKRVGLVWGLALVALLALDAAAQRRGAVDRLFRGLTLPLLLALAVAAGVDGWARRGPPPVQLDEARGR